ncbi:hypothetical protein [Bartonella sp. AU55XJBT]|uniref:hypothetical protein n=1 Tax=Bartonella sp. AU55XJBT TaxID=3019091 RepID=UPI0023620B49|nr:hypothetical protein [Bartonella sp. AU55XJBT]
MKQTLKLLGAVTLFNITGCQFNKTPTSSLGVWKKPGADFTEVGKALLECGMPTPYDVDPETQKLTPNDMVAIDACMVQSGFHHKSGSNWCYTFKEDNLPNCRPGVVFPQPSVKRRLNSPYCKKYKNAPECKP